MKEDILVLYNWLHISDKPEKSDFIFLFGGPTLAIPEKGLQLYRQGLASVIVAASNVGHFDYGGWGKPNAEVFADYLFDNGVDRKSIIVQNTSTNTKEDVLFSLPLLKKHNISLKKIILVARPFHQRRAYATFKKYAPSSVFFNVSCDDDSLTLIDTKPSAIGVRCMQEYERLKNYAAKNDLELQVVPGPVKQAYIRLKNILAHSPESAV